MHRLERNLDLIYPVATFYCQRQLSPETNDWRRSARAERGLEPRPPAIQPLLFPLNPPSPPTDHRSLRMLPSIRLEALFPSRCARVVAWEGKTRPAESNHSKQILTQCEKNCLAVRITQKCCGNWGAPHGRRDSSGSQSPP